MSADESTVNMLYEQAERLLADEVCSRDVQERRNLVEQAIRIAESLVAMCPTDPNAHHLLGLCWYHHPTKNSHRSWRAKHALAKALEIDPNHQFANHYSACLAFDQERFDEALRYLDRTDHAYFKELDQTWRALKAKELRLVCLIRTGRCDPACDELEAFISEYLQEKAREDADPLSGSTALPTELRETAEWLCDLGANRSDPLPSRILQFIEEIGMTDGLWNKELANKAIDSN